MQRLALGTAQFGLAYGVANQQGQVNLSQVAEILRAARSAGMDTLDTAIAYGNSEEQLGRVGVEQWHIISKLPGLLETDTPIPQWVEAMADGALRRLRVGHLHALLLHRPSDLLTPRGNELYAALQGLKQGGLTSRIGISVYSPDDLATVCAHYDIDLVQIPYNVLDRRLVQSGWLPRLREAGVEIHVRSVFLQGLLLMPPETRPAFFQRWQGLWDQWRIWLADHDINALAVCLRFVLAEPGIDRVIVGVDRLNQLQEILTAASVNLPPLPDDLCSNELDLINPSHWPTA